MRFSAASVVQGLFLCAIGLSSVVAAEPGAGKIGPHDWPWWRGPSRDGVAADRAAPVKWSAKENVLWKSPVPGRGHSSPTIIGSLVVMQTADETKQTQSVIAFDRASGRRAWQTRINSGGFPERINRKNTHASTTVAADGSRLFAVAFHHKSIHVTALDMAGKILWQKQIGPFVPDQYKNGYAASPIVHGSTLIVLAECDGTSYMVSLDRVSGKQNWRTPRPSRISYSSPVLARVAGRSQVLIPGCDKVAGFDPDTGKRLWAVAATTMATSGTMVWHNDLVFASGGFPKAETVCIRADGSGKIVWKNQQKCYEQSMIVHDGHVYAMNDGGIVFCWRATDGQEMWKHRLRGPVSASPILAAGNIYISNERGMTYVFKASPSKYTQVSGNQLGDSVFASPSICGGRLYTRVAHLKAGQRQELLYCIGNRAAASR
ncbi:MAG: dehydrogenase [Planctomycetaceae bacterium]|nr:dehydrogenase [Planctomycetaceae bacterium]